MVSACLSLSLVISGCISDSGKEAAGQPFSGFELPIGAYPILRGFDGDNFYQQYFIVRPAGEWEFIEIGMRQRDSLFVQATRQIGVYALSGDSLKMMETHEGKLANVAGISAAQMRGFPFIRKLGPTGFFTIKDLGPDRFSGRDLFVGSSGWKTYILGKLPVDVPNQGIGILPRNFAEPLFTAPDTLKGNEGDTVTLDFATSPANPRTAKYFLADDSKALDSSATGKFSFTFPYVAGLTSATNLFLWARDVDGNRTAEREIILLTTRVTPSVHVDIPFSIRVGDTLRIATLVLDPQNDVTEVTWDLDGDGKPDKRSATPDDQKWVYQTPGQAILTVTAKDAQGHIGSWTNPVNLTNEKPRIDSLFRTDPVYIAEPWKAFIKASDGTATWWIRSGGISKATGRQIPSRPWPIRFRSASIPRVTVRLP